MPDNNLSGEFVLTSEKPKQPTPVDTSTQMPKTDEGGIKKYKKPHFFSSFCYYPDGVRFKDQEQDEVVIILVRQHFITNVPWITGIILLLLLPFAVFALWPFFLPDFGLSPILISLSVLFYYVVVFSFALLYFCIWYFNVGIVTNKRVIDLDVHNILTRILSEARLNSLQDVTATQIGGIRSIFNYGDVDIQTEALRQNIEFYRVPQPNFIRTIVGNLIVHKK